MRLPRAGYRRQIKPSIVALMVAKGDLSAASAVKDNTPRKYVVP